MIRLLVILTILLAIDVYAFQSVRFVTRNVPDWQRGWYALYWLVSAACFAVIIVAQFTDWHLWPKAFRTYSFAMVFIVFVSKLFVDVFLLVDDLARLFKITVSWISSMLSPENVPLKGAGRRIARLDFLVRLGLFAGAIPFFSLIYGMVSGVFNYRIHRIRIRHAGLPDALSGFRMVQVSDIHTGSYHNGEPLRRAVEIINALQGDVVFFTGDLVNNRYEEALPFTDVLKTIKGKHGVYSIFGNHDYGDYIHWESAAAKTANLENLKRVHAGLGWRLLVDEHAYIETGGEKIAVIGVQNWSNRAGFQQYGDMEKAVRGIAYGAYNVLLSHDPSHWDAQVKGRFSDIHLTLSGHTHGMQFGVEIPGFKWSPAQYFYRQWAGLYGDGKQHIYVNRGLGFIGYPGRVGILPEITLIELVKG